jgi:hypothetical protein
MNKTSTRLAALLGLCGGLFASSTALAQSSSTYVPVEVTGYNHDVIADDGGNPGVGAPVSSSTTISFDRGNNAVNWCLVDSSYVNPAGDTHRPATALSPRGIIRSISNTGLTFRLGTPGNAHPSQGLNSLRIDGAGTGTLTLTRPQSCSEVIILAAEGNGTTQTDKTFTIRFTDGTLQVVSNILVPDWYNGTITPATRVGSRVNRGTTPANGFERPFTDPTLYEVHIPLSPANYTKPVQSITVFKTLTDPVLNIMAVSLGATCLSAPTPGQTAANNQNICPGGSATLSLTGSTIGSNITYQWQSSTDGGVTWTDIVGATTTASITVQPAVNTSYRVRVNCGIQVSFSNVTLVTILPNTATLAYGTPPEVPTFCPQQGTVLPLSFSPMNNPSGRFTSSSPGLTVNPTTGALNLATAATGTYTITYAVTLPCPATASTTVNVIRTEASLAYAETVFCRTGSSGAPAFTPSGGTFTSTQGLSINASTGIIDLATSTAGSYNITYTSAGLCPASATASVRIKSDALPVFPNVIVPNSTNTRNNSLHLEFPSEVTNYHMFVFNRWGRRLWESTNPNEGWTAESTSGGTYYYRVDYNDCAGRPQTYKGWVDVIK